MTNKNLPIKTYYKTERIGSIVLSLALITSASSCSQQEKSIHSAEIITENGTTYSIEAKHINLPHPNKVEPSAFEEYLQKGGLKQSLANCGYVTSTEITDNILLDKEYKPSTYLDDDKVMAYLYAYSKNQEKLNLKKEQVLEKVGENYPGKEITNADVTDPFSCAKLVEYSNGGRDIIITLPANLNPDIAKFFKLTLEGNIVLYYTLLTDKEHYEQTGDTTKPGKWQLYTGNPEKDGLTKTQKAELISLLEENLGLSYEYLFITKK